MDLGSRVQGQFFNGGDDDDDNGFNDICTSSDKGSQAHRFICMACKTVKVLLMMIVTSTGFYKDLFQAYNDHDTLI